MTLNIHKRIISSGNDPSRGMSPDISKCLNLFQVNIVKSGPLLQHSVWCIFHVLIWFYKVAEERIQALEFLQVRFDQQHLQPFVLISKDDAVNRNRNIEVLEVAAFFDGSRF